MDMTSPPEAIETDENMDVGEWLSSVAHDPVRFVMEGFRWNEGELRGSEGPTEWQRWLLESIRDGLKTPGEAIKIAISSGHGIGKSAALSWITLWALSTMPDTRGIVTASSEAMLMTRFRAELRIWYRRFRAQQFFSMGATSLTSADPEHEQVWRVDLLPNNPSRPEAFQGLHNKGRRILLLYDEASAIENVIWESCQAIATDEDAEVVWICAGNPLRPEGFFKDIFEKYGDTWRTRHISSLTVPFTNKAEFARWARDYGEDSDFYRTRVLGEFPKIGSTQFIGPAEVDAAMGRELVPQYREQLTVGIDVARYGSDESVIFARRGHDCRSIAPMRFRGLPLDQFEDRIVAFCNAHGPVGMICVDGTGVGGGIVDHLRRRGYLVTDVQFGGKAVDAIDGCRYANQRAYIWARMRAALPYLALPNLPELKEQMCSLQYFFSKTTDAILLEAKDAMRRRGCPSPDLADALATTWAGESAMLPEVAEWAQPQGAISDYNPYSSENIEAGMRGEGLVEARQRSYVPGWAKLRSEYEGWSQRDHIDAWASDQVTHRDQGGGDWE
jgi:hypothetical protein